MKGVQFRDRNQPLSAVVQIMNLLDAILYLLHTHSRIYYSSGTLFIHFKQCAFKRIKVALKQRLC